MSAEIPKALPIAMDGICILAVEHWRLKRVSELTRDASARAVLRHAVRRLGETLLDIGVETIDFAGRPYDAGMAPEVVEVRESPELSDRAWVDETIAPTIAWRGHVINPGRIVVKRSVSSPVQASEVRE